MLVNQESILNIFNFLCHITFSQKKNATRWLSKSLTRIIFNVFTQNNSPIK